MEYPHVDIDVLCFIQYADAMKIFRSIHCTGCPKNETADISTLRVKSVVFFTLLDKASSAEESATKTIKYGWAIYILCIFLEIPSLLNFAWFLWKPIDPCLCCCHGWMGYPKTPLMALDPALLTFCAKSELKIVFGRSNLTTQRPNCKLRQFDTVSNGRGERGKMSQL